MARNRYSKLCLGPSTPIGKRSVMGMTVVGDYISSEDNQRYLLLEKPQPMVVPALKPKRKAAPRRTRISDPVAAPQAEAANG